MEGREAKEERRAKSKKEMAFWATPTFQAPPPLNSAMCFEVLCSFAGGQRFLLLQCLVQP
jgi:hypothetical protein